jgi:hypothetical protein
VTLAHVPGKKRAFEANEKQGMQSLLKYCTKSYPHFSFNIQEISLDNAQQDCLNIDNKLNFDLIVMPNKRRNVFARFFNPGLAHQLLATGDKPMLVIRV